MAEGIRVRHSRSCRSRGGEKCNCKAVVSAPVLRNRRSDTMTSISSSGVRCGIEPGAEQRSSSPLSPRRGVGRGEQLAVSPGSGAGLALVSRRE